jgi:ABC-2 type transport system ATP-binding protein
MNIIEVKNIVKDFIGHRALNDVSFVVPQGEVFGLLGPNGAGKTTLLRIINQINFPDSGQILFNGNPIVPSDVQRIGYLPEERGLYKKMKLGEQAIYLTRLKGGKTKNIDKELKIWFEKFNLSQWWDKKVENLSKGMAQKLQFIVTVVHQPELLIFDEPFSGFDPVNANLLKEEILNLKNKGTSIIFSTHNMGSVEEVCDNIVLINKSQKILDGNVDELKERFSNNLFVVEIDDYKEIAESNLFKVLNNDELRGRNLLTIQLNEGIENNMMLNELVKHGNLISFNKKVPSMNEIFIKAVQSKQN